jgi:uncharacterized protein YycO
VNTQPGRVLIGQYNGKSLTSWIISKKTWSDITHTSAFLNDEVVIEAWGGGVTKRTWREGHTPGTRIRIMRVECTWEQEEKFYAFLESQIGKKYDFAGILGFGLSANLECKDRWFCSELIFAAAQYAGIELLKRIEAHKVYPGLLDVSPRLKLQETRFT